MPTAAGYVGFVATPEGHKAYFRGDFHLTMKNGFPEA
jgi:hypothetical protein